MYASENTAAPPVITVLDGHTLNIIGQVPDLWIAGRRSEIEDVDSTSFIFGIANRGLSFVDASSPISLSAMAPAEVAALAPDEFERLAAGMAVARARYHGLRRNALYAIGSARDGSARDVVKRLVDDQDPTVRDAAAWALDRLKRA